MAPKVRSLSPVAVATYRNIGVADARIEQTPVCGGWSARAGGREDPAFRGANDASEATGLEWCPDNPHQRLNISGRVSCMNL